MSTTDENKEILPVNENDGGEGITNLKGAQISDRALALDSIHVSNSDQSNQLESILSSDEHDVTFTVTLGIAVPTEPDEQPVLKDALNKQTIEAPRAQNYYHLEYSLLPEDELMKTDVVTYGAACKIYMDKYEAKVVKTWQEGELTWFAWSHSHTVTVTRELLLKIFEHTVELRLWNTKDKCSTRARFDRPKAFRLPQPKPGEKPEDIGGVKAMVTKLLQHYLDVQPKKGTLIRPLLSQVLSEGNKDGLENTINQINTDAKMLAQPPTKDGKGGKAIVGGSSQLTEAEQPLARSQSKTKKNVPVKGKNEKPKAGDKDDKKLKKQISEHSRVLAEQAKKFGICNVSLRLALLFGQNKTIISRLESPVPDVEDIFLEVSVDCPLLSDFHQEDLNPMMIQICNATSLPASPISLADLKLKCHPVYCKYTFYKEPEHVTPSREHDKNMFWDDINFVLLGTMESAQLKEFLNGPGIEIEVHDRDRKPEQVALKPTLFGDDLEDEKISNVGTVESRRTLHNPFHGRNKPWDPHGVARVDLSDLLLGCSFLELKIPILNCPIPDILGAVPNAAGKLVGVPGAVDGPVDRPFSAGHYVQHSSMLKVRIRLAFPLTIPSISMAKEYIASSKECPFNRIIFMFDYHNVELLHNLQTLIMCFNARALGMDAMPQNVIDAALSAYKLSIVQQCNLDLDIVTGFHVLDGVRHIFVLEGLQYKAISILWDTLPQCKNSDVCILYNSELSFSRRLYGALDVDLCRVKLHEPLSVIVQQPLLYIRDMVFRPCYDALIKLDQITKMDKMKSVVRNDLFPTVEMVVSLSREFGVPFIQKDFEELQLSVTKEAMKQDVITDVLDKLEIIHTFPPLDNFNLAYEDQLQKKREPKNYIYANIKDVHAKSEAIHAEREKNNKAYISVDMDPAYNYSTQYLNSTEMAKDHLRSYLRELDPSAMFAYNQEFMSGLFCLVNIEQEKKNLEAANRARWRTEKGWTNADQKSVLESHAHPQRPDSARLDELKEEWIENGLHTNIIKSPLHRSHYSWSDRKKDFDLYIKPSPDFGNKAPISVCTFSHAEEQKAAKLKQLEEWRSHVVTDDIRQYFHRVLPATEMTMKGFYSSNQLDRLKGLLKDPVRKCGLVMRGSNVNDIPALAVLNDPSLGKCRDQDPSGADCEHSDAKFCGLRPGDFCHSWTKDDNQIPCNNYKHDKFRLLKGHDFNTYSRSRNKLSIKPILALQPEERDNNLFRKSFSASPYSRLPPLTKSSQTAEKLLSRINHNQISDDTLGLTVENAEPLKDTELDWPLETRASVNGTSCQLNPQTISEPVQCELVMS